MGRLFKYYCKKYYEYYFPPVPIWRIRRKILVPAFSPKIVETFVEVFSEQSEKLAKQLQKCNHVGKFSIWPFLSSYSLDAVCGMYKIKRVPLV